MEKNLSPLDSTVRDYVAGQLFLSRVVPILFTLLPSTIWFYLGWCVSPTSGVCSLGVSILFVFVVIFFSVSLLVCLYGLWSIERWLPSVPEPCYELLRRGEGGGEYVIHPSVPHPSSSQRTAWELEVSEFESQRKKLVIRAVYSDRLGNNIFQYVYARLRAAHLDLAFEAPALGGPFRVVPVRVARWQQGSGGEEEHAFLLRSRKGNEKTTLGVCKLRKRLSSRGRGFGQEVAAISPKVRAWLEEPTSRYSMNTSLFIGWEVVIGGWLRPCLEFGPKSGLRLQNSAKQFFSWGDLDVAVHIRLGDILWGHHTSYRPLPLSFYRSALKAIAARFHVPTLGRVVLVTEAPKHPLIERMICDLKDWGLKGTNTIPPIARSFEAWSSGGVDGDLAALFSSPSMVLSISSFCWWPAALSTKARVLVVPIWGLTRPHTWRPSPREYPLRHVKHDLTIRDYKVANIDASISPRVIEISLDLPCWGGNTKSSYDTLFD